MGHGSPGHCCLAARRCLAAWLTCILLASLCGTAAAQVRPDSAQAAGDTRRVVRFDTLGLRYDTLRTFRPQPYRLRPNILPGSETFWIGRTRLDTAEYRLDAFRGRLWVTPDTPLAPTDTLFARYRTYPFAFQRVYRQQAVDSSRTDDAGRMTVVAAADSAARPPPRDGPFGGVSLQRSGSVTRGVTGGTNRDVGIESGLRMQLQGTLAQDVQVRAVLSDENTPLQPSGTTQRLNEFDRVFVEIDAPQGTAQLGDIDVTLAGSRYAQFNRMLQGAQLRSAVVGPGVGLATGDATVVGAVTRGIYRTQDITPRDGVQGPYRLTGQNGESLIVVIAGSERVYLDGERLERGRSNDYTIDYVRGEITFTARRLVTDVRSITVEFQYTTTQFTRTLVASEAHAGFWTDAERPGRAPRVRLGATVIRQADGRDFSSAFNLSAQDSLRLQQAGDDRAVRRSAERVLFDPEAPYIHYRRDTVSLPSGAVDTIFVAVDTAPADEVPVFRVRFSRVGDNQGRYERVGRQQNGILYEYVGPGEGAYEPTERLPQPTQQRLFDVQAAVDPLPGVTLFGEWARSLNDQNRLSSLDAADNRDEAYTAGLRVAPVPLDVGRRSLGTLSADVQREQRGTHFVTFNPVRPLDFARTWNLERRGSGLTTALSNAGDETTDEATLAWAWTERSRVSADVGRLTVGDAFESWRRGGRVQLSEPGVPRLDLRTTLVTSSDRLANTEGAWLRQQATIRQPVWRGRFTPAVTLEHERRHQRTAGADSLLDPSFAFVRLRPGVQYQTGPLEASASVAFRTEDEALDGRLQDASTAWTVQSGVAWTPSRTFDVRADGSYRVRRFTDAFRIQEQRQGNETVLVQLESSARPLRQAVDLRFSYDAATERTPTLQEVFVRTGPELGQYVWTDANGDGLQQVDEFVPETTPNEGQYVQSFVPSDSLASVARVETRTQLRLDPAQRWRSADARWKRWLARHTAETSVSIREENRTDTPSDVYLLNLARFRTPGLTLDGQLQVQQTVRLFDTVSRYGLEATWRQARGLSDRSAGTETQFLNRWELSGQWRPVPDWSLQARGVAETDRTTSEAFDSRRFDIATREGRLTVGHRITPRVDLSASGSLARKRDAFGPRRALVWKVPLEATWSRAGRFRFRANVEAANIRLDGDAEGLAQFQLTDGRGPGRSWLWGVQGRYVLNEYLRATLSYDGRAPANAPVVHTFRTQLSASF